MLAPMAKSASMLLTIVFVAACLSGTASQAPGDHDPACRLGQNAASHIFPAEWRILVDTYDYSNLFNQLSLNAAWTVNDVDGDSQGWDQIVGGSCTWTLRTCADQASQDNWLLSQFISYEDANEVLFNVSFRFSECQSRPTCSKPYVTLYGYNRDSIASHGDRINPSNYQPLFGDALSSRLEQPSGSVMQIGLTLRLTRPANSNGFYLGLRDEGTCGSITRLIVYYIVCPARQEGLIIYPEVTVPAQNSLDIVFNASCVANAHSVTTLQVTAFSSNGSCSPVASGGPACECDAGYIVSGNGRSCQGIMNRIAKYKLVYPNLSLLAHFA